MVSFREHYLLILEPKEFNIYKDFTEYSTLEFIIGSCSSAFEEYLVELLSQFITLWQRNYRNSLLMKLKSEVNHLIQNSIKGNRITIHTISALGLLAFYIAAMQKEKLILKSFSTMINGTSQFFIYVGLNDYPIIEITEKIQSATKNFMFEDKRTFFFIHSKYLKRPKKMIKKPIH